MLLILSNAGEKAATGSQEEEQPICTAGRIGHVDRSGNWAASVSVNLSAYRCVSVCQTHHQTESVRDPPAVTIAASGDSEITTRESYFGAPRRSDTPFLYVRSRPFVQMHFWLSSTVPRCRSTLVLRQRQKKWLEQIEFRIVKSRLCSGLLRSSC